MRINKVFIFLFKLLTRQIMLHIYFWSFMLISKYINYSNYRILTKMDAFALAIGVTLTSMLPVYIHFLAFSKLLLKKKYILYGISVPVILYLSVIFSIYLDSHVFIIYSTYFGVTYATILILLVTTGLKILKNSISGHFELQEARAQKVQAELQLLKAQINPHFLFNTLNNLYALTLDKSDQAPDTVLRLAALMRYMLETVNKSVVKLSDEIDFIRNYLELEKLRLKKKAMIEFHAPENCNERTIPPMLFIPFIENAFKHGVSESTGDFFVTITISCTTDMLTFTINNSIPTRLNTKINSTNTGLENIRRRLELLYRETFTLIITERDMIYSVKLTVPQTGERMPDQ